MRLIDADALKKKIRKDYHPMDEIPFFEILHIISNAPTVEERPKGKWIADDEWGNCHCSVCNFENNHQPYFCENCGADMRGDV